MNKAISNTIYLGVPIILFCIIRFGFGFDGLYGQDPYEYFQYAIKIKAWILTGSHPGVYHWPFWYPILGGLVSMILANPSFSLQLVSILSLVGCLYYLAKIIELLYGKHGNVTKLYLFLFFVFSPFVFRLSVTVMSDLCSVALLIAGMYHCLKFEKLNRHKHIVFAAFLFAMATMTRYAMFVAAFPVLLIVGIGWIKKPKALLYFIFVLIAGLIPLIPHLILRSEAPSELGYELGWTPLNFFRKSFLTPEGAVFYKTNNLIYALLGVFHPRYLFIGLVFLIPTLWQFRLKRGVVLVILAYLFYALFLAGIHTQNSRFLLPLCALGIVLLFPGFRILWQKLHQKLKWIMVPILLAFQITLCVLSFKTLYVRNQVEQEITQFIDSKYPNSTIYSMDIDLSIQYRGKKRNIKNIYTEAYQEFETNALLLINPSKFEKQWEGMNPMKNINKVKEEYHLKNIRTFQQGWELHVIE